MATPVGHFIAGLAVHALTAPDAEIGTRRRTLVVVCAALAPDLDFALKLFDGRNHHQAEMHSLGFAVLAGMAIALVARTAKWPRGASLGLSGGLGWASHVLLDFMNLDTHPPVGLMAFWPLSDGFFKFPVPLFLDIGRTLDWVTLRHDLLAVSWEAVVLCPLLVLAWRRRTLRPE